ncbi:replication initiator protein A [Deinococcus deserti]|uniref:Putative plasmid replication initiator protein n=1 Tax=Deinococcus deserti (strain DSM 17065 / CIP 109153 / LMG 22923 / VCD115) TaxID=546414 RepID=C1D2K0_DEIDV|nr:replication initiator protein A [Deinococcus deserti]ACO47639.1 putative plasmid replication initiator protein [Deinococcus deserti VCD115]
MTSPPSRFDELNLSRLNLISAVDQAEVSEWDVTFEAHGRIVHVRCEALPKYAVPHGLDSDVTAALINLYIELGEPEDGRFSVSATTLLKLCGWHNTGKYHGILRVCLERLHTSSYSVSGGWRDHPKGRWTHAKFHFIESLDFSSSDGAGAFDDRTIIAGRLADVIVASIRSGYVKPLDTEFMLSLSRPRTRALYRILDGARYDPDHPDVRLDTLEFNLIQWADQCKIPSTIPGNIRRALASPHEELIKRGYLRAATLSGRGKDQRVRYEFVREFVAMDAVLARRFRSYGVADGVARKLLVEHGRDALIASMDRFDGLVRQGVLVVKKTPAAALMHLINHPDDYPYPKGAPAAPAPVRPARVEPVMEAPSVEAEFASLSLEQAAERLISRMNVHYRKLLSVSDLDTLRQAVMKELLSPSAVLEEATAAVVKLQRENFAQTLRARLGLPEERPIK